MKEGLSLFYLFASVLTSFIANMIACYASQTQVPHSVLFKCKPIQFQICFMNYLCLHLRNCWSSLNVCMSVMYYRAQILQNKQNSCNVNQMSSGLHSYPQCSCCFTNHSFVLYFVWKFNYMKQFCSLNCGGVFHN